MFYGVAPEQIGASFSGGQAVIIVQPLIWLFAITVVGAFLSTAFSPVEARRAALFAMPQRKTIGLSKFVSKNRTAKRLYRSIWPAEDRIYDVGRVDLKTFDPKSLQSSRLVSGEPTAWALKRAMDVTLSLILLVFVLPLLLVIAALVRMDSKGPSLYKQVRVGLRGAPITVIKFRTMRMDAEENGAQWAEEDDPRITKVGKFLRKTRLDELPQIWPILTGEMSFVGPRPERPEFTGELEAAIPHFDSRHCVKPGLTGWAQVSAPYSASVDDSRRKLAYDLYYIRHQTALLDWFIVIKTLRVAILGVGSR